MAKVNVAVVCGSRQLRSGAIQFWRTKELSDEYRIFLDSCRDDEVFLSPSILVPTLRGPSSLVGKSVTTGRSH